MRGGILLPDTAVDAAKLAKRVIAMPASPPRRDPGGTNFRRAHGGQPLSRNKGAPQASNSTGTLSNRDFSSPTSSYICKNMGETSPLRGLG